MIITTMITLNNDDEEDSDEINFATIFCFTAKSCKIMQNHAKQCKIMQNNELHQCSKKAIAICDILQELQSVTDE